MPLQGWLLPVQPAGSPSMISATSQAAPLTSCIRSGELPFDQAPVDLVEVRLAVGVFPDSQRLIAQFLSDELFVSIVANAIRSVGDGGELFGRAGAGRPRDHLHVGVLRPVQALHDRAVLPV